MNDELQNIISGEGTTGSKSLIHPAASYLATSQTASEKAGAAGFTKEQEAAQFFKFFNVPKVLILQVCLFFYLLLNMSCTKADKEIIAAIDNDRVLDSSYAITNKPTFNDEFKYQCARANRRWNLNLDTLEFGFNTLQLRIWLGHTMAIVNHVIVIKRVNKQWFGLLYKLKRTEKGYESTAKHIRPKAGWDNLIDRLAKLKIFSIDNSVDRKEYDGNGGGDIPFHIVEVSTPTKYHSYEYDILDGYTERFWQVKNTKLISELLEHEFGFNYTR